MTDVQQPAPLPLSLATTVAVAAAAGALGFVAVYWFTSDLGQQQLDSPSQPAPASPNDQGANRRFQKVSWIGWPWTIRSRSREAAAVQVAAERLSALARTNEAIERDEQLTQVALDSLGDVSPSAAGGSVAGAASTKLFTDADLPSLKMCHRRNGSRMVLGGTTAGQVFKALRGGVHPIAIREFRYQLSAEEQQQLLRLVSKLTRCSDAHVVKLLGFARIPGPGYGFYIASNLFERGSLREALTAPHAPELLWYKRQQQGGLNSSRDQGAGQHIALALARGLHWLHTRGIFHGDVRPSKVLLGDNGRDVKLADAGLCAFMHHDYLAAKSNLGPFIYTAPEVMYGIPGAASPPADIYSFGVLLWQLCTGTDPALDRKRMLRGGEQCPQAVADLIVQCVDRNPDARPTAGELVLLLSRRESQLPPALKPRQNAHPPSGVPIHGGMQAVWDAITHWVYTCYGDGTTPSKDKAHAAGYIESPVDRILDAREWDAYGKMMDVLRHCLAQDDVEQPGSEAYNVLINMYQIYGWAVNAKLSLSCEAVREQRFREMESLDSLLALVPAGYAEAQAAEAAAEAAASIRSNSKASERSRKSVSRPPSSAGGSAEVRTATPRSASENGSAPGSGSGTPADAGPDIVERLGLTQEQVNAILRERWAFMRINRDLVAERAGLVQTLRDYALGKLPDHDAALAASRDLRTNVMTEGRVVWSMHIHVIWEVLSPWQYARMDTAEFPALTDPASILNQVASCTSGMRTGSTDDAKFTWQGIMHEGHFGSLRCDESLIVR